MEIALRSIIRWVGFATFKSHYFVRRACLLLCFLLAAGCSDNLGTGDRPPVLPYWSLLPGAWDDNHNTETFVRDELVAGYLNRDIPLGFVLIDSPWSRAYNDFVIDRDRYPTFENMVADFRDQGLNTIVWLTGAINHWGYDDTSAAEVCHEVVKEA